MTSSFAPAAPQIRWTRVLAYTVPVAFVLLWTLIVANAGSDSTASEAMSMLFSIAVFFVLFILPFIVTARICKERNRSVDKGLFVTLFLGWIATVCLWLGLPKREVQHS